jgi:hypothetical protein
MTENVQNSPVEQQPSQQEQQPSPAAFSIPEPYQTKEWAKGIKTPEDLWKLTDNAQSLIGKRPAGIPAPDAPDAEWEKFYSASGRPEKPDLYKFSDPEGIPEGVDLAPFKQKAASILHGAGLNQKQAEKVWQMFMKEEMGAASTNKASIEAKSKELDAEFDKLTKEHFGDKAENVSASVQDFINQNVPEGLRSAYTELADNPKALVALQAGINAALSEVEKVKKEYGAEGKLTTGEQPASQNIDETRTELAKLRISNAARDFTHADHKKTMEKINELSARVQKAFG